jgi:hypothetical protein
MNQVYSFVPIPGAQQHKRPRRKFEEIERMYLCGWNGCQKSYGTLNHLNAHVTMQQHGPKRLPDGKLNLISLYNASRSVEVGIWHREWARETQTTTHPVKPYTYYQLISLNYVSLSDFFFPIAQNSKRFVENGRLVRKKTSYNLRERTKIDYVKPLNPSLMARLMVTRLIQPTVDQEDTVVKAGHTYLQLTIIPQLQTQYTTRHLTHTLARKAIQPTDRVTQAVRTRAVRNPEPFH